MALRVRAAKSGTQILRLDADFEMFGVFTRHRYEFHASREVNTPHSSNQTPEAGSSKYWKSGRNRTREEGVDGET